MSGNSLFIQSCISLVACSTDTNSPAATKQAPVTDQVSNIQTGTNKMLDVTAEIDRALSANDEAKLKTLGPKLEDTWSQYEDHVKGKYADLYKKVEDALYPTIAGTQANPVDKDAVGKLNDQLKQALNELVAKAK